LQILAEAGFTEIAKPGVTLTVTVCVAEQPPPDPVTVYIVVVVGLAVTLAPVVDDNPVAGDQIKLLAPLTDKDVDAPLQMLAEAGVMDKVMPVWSKMNDVPDVETWSPPLKTILSVFAVPAVVEAAVIFPPFCVRQKKSVGTTPLIPA